MNYVSGDNKDLNIFVLTVQNYFSECRNPGYLFLH